MATKKVNVKNVVQTYYKTLSCRIGVEHIFIFGSAARGTMKKDSDIDMMIISRDFATMPFMKRLELLSEASYCCADTVPLDVWGYTPQEFTALKKSDSPNVQKLLREGRFVK